MEASGRSVWGQLHVRCVRDVHVPCGVDSQTLALCIRDSALHWRYRFGIRNWRHKLSAYRWHWKLLDRDHQGSEGDVTGENGMCHAKGREEQERLRRARGQVSAVSREPRRNVRETCAELRAADGPADRWTKRWPLDLARTHRFLVILTEQTQ